MIEICNLTRRNINTGALKNTARVLLKKENKAYLDLSVALVGEKRMRELNRIYRGRDHATNVLAFPIGNAKIPSEVEGYLGEILLCPAKIRKDAKKYGIVFEQELGRIFRHGLLHILGYSHKRMQKFEIPNFRV